MRGGFRANLVELAAADKSRGIGGLADLVHRAGDFRTGAARQLNQFREGFAALLTRGHARHPRRALPRHADEQGALRNRSYVLSLHI